MMLNRECQRVEMFAKVPGLLSENCMLTPHWESRLMKKWNTDFIFPDRMIRHI